MTKSKLYLPDWIVRELVLEKSLSRGDRSAKVKIAQEWLVLNGFYLEIDGVFGAATENAVVKFQQQKGIKQTGVIDSATYEYLTYQMRRVLLYKSPVENIGFRTALINVIRLHFAVKPVELNGNNSGAWVRLYMRGNDGAEWFWCAGFVSYLLHQAAHYSQKTPPLPYTFSCDEIAFRAQQAGRFLNGRSISDPKTFLQPGDIFLKRRSAFDWSHTGFIAAIKGDYFETVEGNTSTTGSRNGGGVHSLTRAFNPDVYDFVTLPKD